MPRKSKRIKANSLVHSTAQNWETKINPSAISTVGNWKITSIPSHFHRIHRNPRKKIITDPNTRSQSCQNPRCHSVEVMLDENPLVCQEASHHNRYELPNPIQETMQRFAIGNDLQMIIKLESPDEVIEVENLDGMASFEEDVDSVNPVCNIKNGVKCGSEENEMEDVHPQELIQGKLESDVVTRNKKLDGAIKAVRNFGANNVEPNFNGIEFRGMGNEIKDASQESNHGILESDMVVQDKTLHKVTSTEENIDAIYTEKTIHGIRSKYQGNETQDYLSDPCHGKKANGNSLVSKPVTDISCPVTSFSRPKRSHDISRTNVSQTKKPKLEGIEDVPVHILFKSNVITLPGEYLSQNLGDILVFFSDQGKHS